MTNSATETGVGLRERKMRATRKALIALSRQQTAEHGLAGFTIEEICETVNISRRTFFNYFPTKEDAVLGLYDDGVPTEALEAFLNDAAERTLADALFELISQVGEQFSMTRAEHDLLHDVLEKEPQLLRKLMGHSGERQRELAELISRREQFPPQDLRSIMAAAICGQITMHTGRTFFDSDNSASYRDLLGTNFSAAAYLFTSQPSTAHKESS